MGYEAFSCDLQSCSGGHPEWHLKMDVFDAIRGGQLWFENGDRKYIPYWDMAIFFPDCTYLTNTANKWYKDQPPRKSGTLVGKERRAARENAIDFALKLYHCGIPKVAMENPIGILSTRFRKPDQIIQPWWFGHKESKSTCLWLKNLPKLQKTKVVEPVYFYAAGKKYSPTHYNSTISQGLQKALSKKELAKKRSKTFPGFAAAMADQWSKYL